MTKCGIVSLSSFVLFLILNLQTAFADSTINTKVDALTTGPSISDQEIDKLSGQFLILGISGTTLTKNEEILIRKIKPGGIILFKRNISSFQQLVKLNLSLQKISREFSGRNLLISTDQEGGRVARLQISPAMPSALAMGMTNDEKLVEEVSFESGRLLKALGINMNLAPVLDVLIDNSYSFIGERSFGSNAKNVSNLGSSFAQGQLRSGIIPTSKHFPGAGMIQKDPHVEKVNAANLTELELSPFKSFAQIFPSAMMMSHASYPSLDSSGLPATYSDKIMKDLLRKKWGYRGLIITDDMLMKGADNGKTQGESAIQTLLAGADMIMVSWGAKNQLQVKDAIYQAIKSGQIPVADYRDKAARIHAVKNLIHTNLNPRIPASEQTVYESKKMFELDSRILNINLERDLSNVQFRWTDQYSVITNDMNFVWGLERALGKKVYQIKPEEISKIDNKELLQKSGIVLAPIPNKKAFYQLSGLSSEIKKKSILFLLSQPVQANKKSYLSIVRLFHQHIELPKKLGELIRLKTNVAQNN